MADFQEVIKQYKRMCNNADCYDCPFYATTSLSFCKMDNPCNSLLLADPKEYEPIIMQWAAEHPEPVYPTWWEWLSNIGAVTRKVTPDVAAWLINTGVLDTIPADIAQKLGIEPKEG